MQGLSFVKPKSERLQVAMCEATVDIVTDGHMSYIWSGPPP